MSEFHAASITNWVWLAELAAQRHALAVGQHPAHIASSLAQHFETVDRYLLSSPAEVRLPFDTHSLDCVVFNEQLGEAVLSSAGSSAEALLRETKRVLRSGGCAFLPVADLARRRPHRLGRPLRRVGFGTIRPVYVFQSLDRPSTLIPATRRATRFFQSWAWGGLRGRLKAIAAMAGAHHLTQPALFFLAYP